MFAARGGICGLARLLAAVASVSRSDAWRQAPTRDIAVNSYQPPLKEMKFALAELAQLGAICAQPRHAETTPDLVHSVLDEAGRFAQGVLDPLQGVGDADPPSLIDGEVREPAGYAQAYRQLAEGGWTGISAPPEFGGMGLPRVVSAVAMEMWCSACTSLALCPMLSEGAIEALKLHASPELQATYLRPLITGRWTGTMNLTEPQAGSDLAAIRTRAVPEGDHYRLYGNKIFITWGDHGMAENIVHLVLARIEGAPTGVHGISLFLAPKFLVDAGGRKGARSDITTIALERKMGIHGSPTCALSFGAAGAGAIGFLVGTENRGLAHLFTMMNNARLNVGVQSVGLAERSCQQALAWATERVQGKTPGHGDGAIIQHPDVRRMLMLMRALTEASRAICLVTAAHLDLADAAPDADVAQAHAQRGALLIPIAKAWSSEVAQEVTSLGVQVHGGMGFIEEAGAAQLMRDVRIAAIYEGTNGIQANDLTGRKLLRDGGAGFAALLSDLDDICAQLNGHAALEDSRTALVEAVQDLRAGAEWLKSRAADPQAVSAAAFNFLMAAGACLAGALLAKAARAADSQRGENEDARFLSARVRTANFFAAHVLPRCAASLHAMRSGDRPDLMLTDAEFGI